MTEISWQDHRGKTFTVLGMKGAIDSVPKLVKGVEGLSKEMEVEVQLVDATKVYGREHLEVAAERAIRAFDEKRNSANSLPVEVLLYASGKRQITEALAFMGLHDGKVEIGAVVIADEQSDAAKDIPDALGLERDDSVLQGNEAVLEAFDIPEDIRKGFPSERWGDLIIEKVTLLDIEK